MWCKIRLQILILIRFSLNFGFICVLVIFREQLNSTKHPPPNSFYFKWFLYVCNWQVFKKKKKIKSYL